MSLEKTAKASIEYAQRNLFVRFFVTLTLCFIAIMLGVGVILFHQLDAEQKKLLNSISSEYQRILTGHGSEKLTEIATNNPQQLIEHQIAMFSVQQNSSPEWAAGSRFNVNNLTLSEFHWSKHPWYRLLTSPNYLTFLLTGKQEFWLVLDLKVQINAKYQQWRWIAMALALLCFIISIVVWRLIRSTLLPLHSLASVVDQTSDWSVDSLDKIATQQSPTTSKGLEVLHLSLNNILRRLVATIYSMENTVDAIAHDLRTPLARISLSAEKSLSNPMVVSEESKYLQDSLSDCAESAQQANHMLTTLMGIHDEASGKHCIVTTNIELASLIRETASYYQELCEEHDICINTDLLNVCELNTDAGRLQQILVNLIDNSIKYSKKGTTISLECGVHKNKQVFLQVSDQGIGIEKKHHKLIFKRLYRVDSSRTNAGYGLGLAQVKTIINTLNGSIELTSSLGKGSCFRIILPSNI